MVASLSWFNSLASGVENPHPVDEKENSEIIVS